MAEGLLDTTPTMSARAAAPCQSAPADTFIDDVWYVAGLAKDVKRGRRQARRILGDTLQLHRDKAGVLSGTFQNAPARICEQEGLIWLYSGDAPAETDLAPPRFGGAGGRVRYCEEAVIPAHQDDAVYGLLDPAHTPFVHRSPIWRGSGVLKNKAKTFEPNAFGWTMTPHAPVNSDIYKLIGGAITVRIEFTLPGLRAEYIENARHGVLGLTTLTPIDARHTCIRQIFYWDTPILSLLRPIIPFVSKPFLQQDVDIMALRRANEGFGGKGMLIGDSDRQFLWYTALKKEWRDANRDGRAFTNRIEPATLRWRT